MLLPTQKLSSTATMYTDLEIELEFFNYNGSMNLEISDDETMFACLRDVTEKIVTIQHRINLPSQLKFTLSNKNYNTDTEVSADGLILADKYVRLNKLALGRMPINIEKLYKICEFRSDRLDEVIHDPQWHFNGVVTIDFFESNFIKYLLLIDNKFKHK
jgi:hypothetical protein